MFVPVPKQNGFVEDELNYNFFVCFIFFQIPNHLVMPNIWKHLVSVKLSAFIFEFHLMCGYL
jgi:hypothetical protein